MIKRFLLIGLVMVCFFAFAQESEESGANELSVTADNMTLSMDNHVIELEGNVLVENETMKLTARKMVVHLDAKNKLKNIEAIGAVRVQKISSSESATGETGFYDAETKLITLRGNCVVMRGNNVLTGNTVVFDSVKQTIQVQRPQISLNLGEMRGKKSEEKKEQAAPVDNVETPAQATPVETAADAQETPADSAEVPVRSVEVKSEEIAE